MRKEFIIEIKFTSLKISLSTQHYVVSYKGEYKSFFMFIAVSYICKCMVVYRTFQNISVSLSSPQCVGVRCHYPLFHILERLHDSPNFSLKTRRAAKICVKHLIPVSSHPTVLSINANSLIFPLTSFTVESIDELHYMWHCFLALSIPKKVDTWDLTFSGSIRYAASHIGQHFTALQKTTMNNNFETQRLYFKVWPCHSLDVCYHVSHLTSMNLSFLLGTMKTVSICNGYLLIFLPCIHFFSLFHCYSKISQFLSVFFFFFFYSTIPPHPWFLGFE